MPKPKPTGLLRAVVPRAYPRHVDMGVFSRLHTVRYDVERQLYDVRDALLMAFGGERAVKTAVKSLGKGAGEPKGVVASVRWSDCASNAGRGRQVAPCSSMVRILKRAIASAPRSPVHATGVQMWFEEQVRAGEPPALLEDLVPDAEAMRNVL